MTDPKAATTRRDGSRTYTIPTPDGPLLLPSVTTILGIIDKPAIKYWVLGQASEFVLDNMEWIINELSVNRRDEVAKAIKGAPWRKRDDAATKGTDAHNVIERFLLGGEVSVEEQSPYFRAARDFISDWGLGLEAAEATVYNVTYGYAGTMDALMSTDAGRVGVVDWKTRQGKRVSQTKVYETELLQAAAYARAEWILLPNGESVAMPEVDGGSVVALCEDGFKVGRASLPEDFEAFLAAKFLYDWREGWKERDK